MAVFAEYAVAATLIVVASAGAIGQLGDGVTSTYEAVVAAMDGDTGSTPDTDPSDPPPPPEPDPSDPPPPPPPPPAWEDQFPPETRKPAASKWACDDQGGTWHSHPDAGAQWTTQGICT